MLEPLLVPVTAAVSSFIGLKDYTSQDTRLQKPVKSLVLSSPLRLHPIKQLSELKLEQCQPHVVSHLLTQMNKYQSAAAPLSLICQMHSGRC